MRKQFRRRYVALHLGEAESDAFERCPVGMARGRWLNLLAAQIATWSAGDWAALLSRIAPRPERGGGKLTVALRPEVADMLDSHRGGIPLADVLRTALLRAAAVAYEAVPMVPLPSEWRFPVPQDGRPTAQVVVPRPMPVTSPPPPRPPEHRWTDRAASQKEVRELAAVFRGRGLKQGLYQPDLSPPVQVRLMEWLKTAAAPAEGVLIFGVDDGEDGGLVFTGIKDAVATAEVLKATLEGCGRETRGEIVRYPVDDVDGEVALTLQVWIL